MYLQWSVTIVAGLWWCFRVSLSLLAMRERARGVLNGEDETTSVDSMKQQQDGSMLHAAADAASSNDER